MYATSEIVSTLGVGVYGDGRGAQTINERAYDNSSSRKRAKQVKVPV